MSFELDIAEDREGEIEVAEGGWEYRRENRGGKRRGIGRKDGKGRKKRSGRDESR